MKIRIILFSILGLLYWWPELLVQDTLTTGRMVVFLFIGCMVLSGHLWKISKWLSASFLSLSASVCYNTLFNRTIMLRGSLSGDPVATINLSSVLGLMIVLSGILIVLWSFHYHSLHRHGLGLARMISIVGAVSGIISILQYCGIEWPYSLYSGNSMSLGDPPGLFGNPGIAGGTLAMILPLAIYSMPITVLPIVAGLLLSKSTIGFVAAAIGTTYYFAFNFKSLAIVSMVLISIAAFAYYADSHRFHNVPRLRVWKATAYLWPRYPRSRFDGDQELKLNTESILFGHGLRMFRLRFPYWDYRKFNIGLIKEKHGNERIARDVVGMGKDRKLTAKDVSVGGTAWTHAHNEFIHILFEAGLVTMVSILGLLAFVIRRLFSNLKCEDRAWGTVILAGLVFAMWSFPFHSVPSAAVFAVGMGQLLRGGV